MRNVGRKMLFYFFPVSFHHPPSLCGILDLCIEKIPIICPVIFSSPFAVKIYTDIYRDITNALFVALFNDFPVTALVGTYATNDATLFELG